MTGKDSTGKKKGKSPKKDTALAQKESGALAEKESGALEKKAESPLMKPEKDIGPQVKGEGQAERTEAESGETADTEKVEGKDREGKMDLDRLRTELEEKVKQAEDYYERLVRTQADFENYKKRMDRELSEFKTFATAQLMRDLLGIMDDFQNALSTSKEGATGDFMKGVEMIYKNLYGTLEKEGLSIITGENEKFDPWKHEAVEMVPTEEHPEHTVLGILSPGYKYRDKILRPAKVRVSTLPDNVERESVEVGQEGDQGRDQEEGQEGDQAKGQGGDQEGDQGGEQEEGQGVDQAGDQEERQVEDPKENDENNETDSSND